MSLVRYLRLPSAPPTAVCSAILLLLYVPTYLLVFNADLDLNGDNARFYVLGKALSQGAGYVNAHTPDSAPASLVPPGYPALIAIAIKAGFSDFADIKILNGILFALSLLLLFDLSRKLSGNANLALIATGLALFNGHLLRYASMMMSEIPFLLVSSAALCCAMRLDSERDTWRNPFVYLLFLSTVAAYYARGTGVALFAALIAWHLYRRQWSILAGHVATWALLVAPWLIRERSLQRRGYLDFLLLGNPYLPETGTLTTVDFLSRILLNAERYVTGEIQHALFNYVPPVLIGFEWWIGFSIVAVVLFGLFRLANHRILVCGYLAVTFVVILSWPQVWFGPRFLLPIVPLILLCFTNGLYQILGRLCSKLAPERRFHPLILSLLLVWCWPNLKYVHSLQYAGCPTRWNNYLEVARWAKVNIAEDAVVGCRKPFLFHLVSERFVSGYSFTTDDREFIADLRQRRVDHVVIDNLNYDSTRLFLIPAVQRNPRSFRKIFSVSDPDTWLLELEPDATANP